MNSSNGGPAPVANLTNAQFGGAERPPDDDNGQSEPRREPFTMPGDSWPPPGDMRDIHRGMSDSERHKNWWRLLLVGVAIWDVSYLGAPWLAGTDSMLGFIPASNNVWAFANTVTAIVTAGVILAVTKLPWPRNDKQHDVR